MLSERHRELLKQTEALFGQPVELGTEEERLQRVSTALALSLHSVLTTSLAADSGLEADILTRSCAALDELASDAELRGLLGGLGLVVGLAEGLPLLSKHACGGPALPPSARALCLAYLRLLGTLLRCAQNSALLHVRSDTTHLARLSRWATDRSLRHAAMLAMQGMLAVECTRSELAVGVGLLVEGLQLCVHSVHASADGV